jgi:two-component system, chemotaxis family, chemotaxis protein CheY
VFKGNGGVRNNTTINLAGMSFLLADPNPQSCVIMHGIFRAFGVSRIIDVRSTYDAIQVLTNQKIDLMLCDPKLPTTGGLAFIRSIRRNPENPVRTMPILVATGDTRISLIKEARDSGANMVVAKPMSPATLYERLTWVAFNPRNYVDAPAYFGPDRRFKIEGLPDGSGRRTGDTAETLNEESGPALSQNEIDNLLEAARTGAT